MDNHEILRDLSNIGKPFSGEDAQNAHLNDNPLLLLVDWIDKAISCNCLEPNHMVLSTVTAKCRVSSRVVLCKYITNKGLVFFTNYESRKAHDIESMPYVAVNFFWPEMEKQVRIEGAIEKLEPSFSDTYFKSRPFASQIGAIVSRQSKAIPSREYLLEKADELEQSLKGKELIRPHYWGGYLILPESYEFWIGRPNRLSNRFQYKHDSNSWLIDRLSP
jgi:pyridoxamine 5'-phosphate oxidase